MADKLKLARKAITSLKHEKEAILLSASKALESLKKENKDQRIKLQSAKTTISQNDYSIIEER